MVCRQARARHGLYLNGNPKVVEAFTSLTEKQHTEYWELGKVKREGKLVLRSYVRWGSKYRDWLPEGAQRSYYETGALHSEETYRDGNLIGTSKQLWANGKPASIDQYSDGVRTASKRWDKTGQLIADEEFEADGSRKVK